MIHRDNKGICVQCGSDPFKTWDYDKITKEQTELQDRFKKVLAYHGRDEADRHIKEIEQEQAMKWLQRKVKKQAETIRKLEEKLRRQGEQPYKEEIPREITGM